MGAWVDLAIMGMTFTLSIVWNLEAGIVISMVVSLLLVVHRSSQTRMTILGRIRGTDRWKPLKENPDAEEPTPGVLIVRIRESLDFANTSQLKGVCLLFIFPFCLLVRWEWRLMLNGL